MRKAVIAISIIAAGLVPIAAIGAARAAIGAPLILYNPSPSEPVGFYWLSSALPRTGQIIAFRVPEAGRGYAVAHLPSVARSAILKAIAATEGARICASDDGIFLDGTRQGTIASQDSGGARLPRWSGCHRLAPGEYFVLSNRIPNSFDSRYYGPVTAKDLIGVYRPLWTEDRP